MRTAFKVLEYVGGALGALVIVLVATPLLVLLGRRQPPPPLEIVFEDGYYPVDPNQEVLGDE